MTAPIDPAYLEATPLWVNGKWRCTCRDCWWTVLNAPAPQPKQPRR